MEDPSSLLKEGIGTTPMPSGPPKQIPMPPLLKKKDSNPMGALSSALNRAMSQPGSRTTSRPGSPSRLLSLPAEPSDQFHGTSDLLSMAAQDLQSSITTESGCINGQTRTYEGIDTSAMSQIVQNTITMQNTASAQQTSTWGFSSATVSPTTQGNGVGMSAGYEAAGAFKPLANKSKSVSGLNIMETSFEINDPKPMEHPQSASFKPLEPSRQTHNAPIKMPKPVSPVADTPAPPPRFSAKGIPPVEERGSVLAPKDNQQIGVKKADYSYYLDLI